MKFLLLIGLILGIALGGGFFYLSGVKISIQQTESRIEIPSDLHAN